MHAAISNYHAGQIVEPRITVTTAGRGRVKVNLYWLDKSDNSHLRPASFTGPRMEAEEWLEKQGVVLDAQGIYGW